MSRHPEKRWRLISLPLATSLVHHHPCSVHLCLSTPLPSFLLCSVPVSSSLTFSPGGWSHLSDHAIGPLPHSQKTNWWSPVPVTKSRDLPGAGYQAIKWVKGECGCQAVTWSAGTNQHREILKNCHFCPLTRWWSAECLKECVNSVTSCGILSILTHFFFWTSPRIYTI